MPAQTEMTIPLRRRDIDELGHLNQSVYHELLEEVRTALMDRISDAGLFVLARVELDHRREVRIADREVLVRARVDRIGGKSVTFVNDVLLPDGTTAATGIAVVVGWDPASRASRELTAAEREGFGG